MSRALISALTKLVQAPQGRLASSNLTPAQQQALDSFAQQSGGVRRQNAGRGLIYLVTNAELVSRHLKSLSPASEMTLAPDLPERARNIARQRNSKSGAHQHEIYYLLLKAFEPNVIWRNDHGGTLDVSAATGASGVAALALSRDDHWYSEKPLWLVENQALFDHLHWYPSTLPGALTFYSGHLSNLLIDWLAARPRAREIILFPDYDGVGLMNYARLCERGIENCSFWLMPDWKRLMGEFGSRLVWQNTLTQFMPAVERLRVLSRSPELCELIQFMHDNSLALEQESIWLA